MSFEVAISVIMSTHNRAHYLPDALRALAAQDCDVPFEVILIDNASTDDTAGVFQEWCQRDSRFRTAQEPRLGLSYGKNAGINLARAPLLLFSDDDMLVDRYWISSYHNCFARRKDELVLVGGPIIPTPHDLGKWPAWFEGSALADLGLLQYREERALENPEYVWGGNMAVPARLFDRFGLWDATVGRKGDQRGTFEDTEFQDRVRKEGVLVWFCPGATVYHRIHRQTVTPRQISSTAFNRGRNAVFENTLPIWHEVRLVPKRNAVIGLWALVSSLFWWCLWVMAFWLLKDKSCFNRARCAAFASGHSLDSLRAGRNSMRLFHGASRIAFPVRRLLLRLIPDHP